MPYTCRPREITVFFFRKKIFKCVTRPGLGGVPLKLTEIEHYVFHEFPTSYIHFLHDCYWFTDKPRGWLAGLAYQLTTYLCFLL